MSKFIDKETGDALYEAMLTLKTKEDCHKFIQDLCTMSEITAMEQRMDVAMMLEEGLIYRDILEKTGASSATISRVNRCLHYGSGGYKTVIAILKEQDR